jgi:3-deoxy-manno-octulosonate cytidylyltransferase (CMP-KDO synthetase)
MSTRIVGVIPSRWGSTRFPGKSLAPIAGRPLLARVIDRVRLATRLDAVWVATDDDRIAAAARDAGAEPVMTPSDLPSGTDRVAWALRGREADIVVNIQGDEPLLDPAAVDSVAAALADDPSWDMATAANPIDDPADLHSPDVVKVVRAADGAALYFSRSVIPYVRGAEPNFPPVPGVHLRHIGLYAYRRTFLERLVATPPSPLEQLEKLEQLRALQLGCRMKVLDAPASGLGVDTPSDIPRVEALLRSP